MNETEMEDEDPMRPLHDEWFGDVDAPLIFRAVNLEKWPLLGQLFQRNKKIIRTELKHVDPYGYSAAHYASWWSSTPPELFEDIIKYSPSEICSRPNRKGRTPLHLAAWRGCDFSVLHIASQHPEAAAVADRNQKSPLTDACSRNRSDRVIEALLNADYNQVTIKNRQGLSPALLFFRLSNGFMSVSHRSHVEHTLYLEKVRLILAAERRVNLGVIDDLADEWKLLIAAIESPSCPFPFVKVLLNRHQATIPTFRDESGSTLLHLAVSAAPFAFKRFFQCDRCQQEPSCTAVGQEAFFNRDPGRSHWGVRCRNSDCIVRENNPSIHYVKVPVVMKEQAVVKYLLQQFPDLASIRDGSGRLPMEAALTSGRTWHSGIRELVQANPNSLSQVDSLLGLYPYQLAAQAGGIGAEEKEGPPPRKRLRRSCKKTRATTGSTTTTKAAGEEETSLHQVDTIFNLLRQCPSLVKFAENA
ncbi:unnamed protein product [Cylindrotheca closterium]|uniref:Uncharacterized protein n=1 Tax=Cylindrotheca closterium TaxID=2856 RepID=A0AAD2JLX0_9STRA|nr:unnamed protein product [Cylindrotheca closterium]